MIIVRFGGLMFGVFDFGYIGMGLSVVWVIVLCLYSVFIYY